MKLWGHPHSVSKSHWSPKVGFGGVLTLMYHCVISGIKRCVLTPPQEKLMQLGSRDRAGRLVRLWESPGTLSAALGLAHTCSSQHPEDLTSNPGWRFPVSTSEGRKGSFSAHSTCGKQRPKRELGFHIASTVRKQKLDRKWDPSKKCQVHLP